jgi:hypothetical protein
MWAGDFYHVHYSQRIIFCCWIVVSAANQFSLLNCGVYSESVLAAEFMESAANQFSLSNLWSQQWISFADEVWCQQRISFRCRTVVSATNQFSLLNPMFQRISSLTRLCHQQTSFGDNSIILNLNFYEWLFEYYEGSIIVLCWRLFVTDVYMSIAKDLLLCIHSAKLLRMFVWVLQGIYCCIVLNINYYEWLDE